jgi:hypothetical protein
MKAGPPVGPGCGNRPGGVQGELLKFGQIGFTHRCESYNRLCQCPSRRGGIGNTAIILSLLPSVLQSGLHQSQRVGAEYFRKLVQGHDHSPFKEDKRQVTAPVLPVIN